MKYVQPYGIVDENASYINGNPATGTMGSIPPAASIEHPQREIVNFLTASALTPLTADLQQLSKAVQSGKVNYAQDVGSVNTIVINPGIPVTAYAVGQRFIIKVANQNTSSVTVNVSGVGPVALIHTDLNPINPWELKTGQLIEVAYDGASWQAISGVTAGAVVLTQVQNLYVNGTTGSDTLYDGTQATVSGGRGPFATVAKALTVMTKYNLSGFDFIINVADGTYSRTTPLDFPTPNGSGRVILRGNLTTPTSCVLWNTGTGSTLRFLVGGIWTIEGFSIRSTAAAAGDGGNGIWVQDPASVNLGRMNYAPCFGQHVHVGPGGKTHQVGNVSITGGGESHISAHLGGAALAGSGVAGDPTLTISNAVTFLRFAIATDGGHCRPNYGTITGFGNVTGSKYHARGNGVISTGQATNYLPGDAVGTLNTGGQYV